MKRLKVKRGEEIPMAKRWPKIYRVTWIAFMVMGILNLLRSVLLTMVAGISKTIVYLMGIVMKGYGG